LNEIIEITIKHFSSFDSKHVSHKMSKNDNYLAITVTVLAENQKILDAFYEEITKHPDVKMVL
jgi:putative lipoic acid-binding regulatory protein